MIPIAFNILAGNRMGHPLVNPEQLSHAYILWGGTAAARQEAMAELARAQLCEAPAKECPCGQCRQCRKALAGLHPDIITVEKEKDKKELTVKPIGDLVADAPVLPNDSSRKVYCIPNADEMNLTAQNKLLKVLEEPPTHVAILMETVNPRALLATVRSRSVELQIPTPDGTAEAVDIELRASAEALAETIAAKSPAEILALLMSCERMERLKLKGLLDETLRVSTERLQTESDPKKKEKLIRLVKAIVSVQPGFAVNVNAGHIVGWLMTSVL